MDIYLKGEKLTTFQELSELLDVFPKKIILIVAVILGIIGTAFLLFNISNSSAIDDFSENNLFLVEKNSLAAVNNPLQPEKEYQVAKKITVIATAYSSTPLQTDNTPFVTAAGTVVRDGIIANNLLPFGTKIKIPEIYGDKVFVVEDRMHSKKGYYHIDIWFSSYWEAKSFGAKTTYIEVLEN